MRKGQIAGQIFIYIIAIVVVGFIIVYGYSAVKSFRQRGEEVEYISLKTSIENSIKSIASDYGSVKRPNFDVPGKYTKVCFVNKALASGMTDTACSAAMGGDYEPLVCVGWSTGRNNVFLIPDGSEAFDAGEIRLTKDSDDNAPYLCVPVVGNRIRVTLTGKGDRVQVEEYIPEDEQTT